MKRIVILPLILTVLFSGLPVVNARADSLFSSKVAARGTLAAPKRKKFAVGDIVTVLVRESIDASTSANTDTEKESELESQVPAASNTFFTNELQGGANIISPQSLPNWDIDSEAEFEAKGKTIRKNTLTMTVACTVTRVLENGNIEIEGKKRVTVNREDSILVVSGVARTKDVTPENTIQSNQLADAVVELKGRGPLWNNQRRGILTKILDWFSPF